MSIDKKKIIKGLENAENLLERALENVVEDRAVTNALLLDLVAWIKQSADRHEKVGGVAAKYFESLQRSNDQLIKISDMMKKRNIKPTVSFSGEEKENLFDEIQNNSSVEIAIEDDNEE